MSDLLIVTRIQRPAPGTKLWGPNNRLLQSIEIDCIIQMYWPPSQQQNAYKVANCESGWWTGAWAWEGEDSRGIFQLNVEAHPEMLNYDLFDPQINAYFAYGLWKAQGWGPWTCAHELHIV